MALSKCFYDLSCDPCLDANCTYVQFRDFSLCVESRSSVRGNGQVISPPNNALCPSPNPLPPCNNGSIPAFVNAIITNTTLEVAEALSPALKALGTGLLITVGFLVAVTVISFWLYRNQRSRIAFLQNQLLEATGSGRGRRSSPILAGDLRNAKNKKKPLAAFAKKFKLSKAFTRKSLSSSRAPLLNSTLNSSFGSLRSTATTSTTADTSIATLVDTQLSTITEEQPTVIGKEPQTERLISFAGPSPRSSVHFDGSFEASSAVREVTGVRMNNPNVRRHTGVVIVDYGARMEDVD